jgi:hypothetical protein
MKRFLRDVGLFLLLQLVLLVALDAAYMRYQSRRHYLAGFLLKARRLEETKSPRILIVGGSSAAFGVNSAALERVSGRPVVNLGLNAGLGLRFILAQAASAVRPGDLVVLMPEYALFYRGEPLDSQTVMLVLRFAPDAVRFVPLRKVPHLLDQGLSALTERLHTLRHILAGSDWRHPYYNSDAFDERGDVVAHLESGSRRGKDEHVGVPTPEDAETACRSLEAFVREASATGARVVLVPAAIPYDDYEAQQQQVVALWSYVERRTGVEVMGVGKRYDRDLFLDTSYHLTRFGRQQRSRDVITLVRGLLTRPLDAAARGD